MVTKNIKVSEVVYDTLESQKSGNEAFDDVLRRVLNLDPELEDLAAYLPEDLRERSQKLADFIGGLEEFEIEVESDADDGYDHVRYLSSNTGLTIARIRFDEEWVITDYRNRQGDLREISSFSAGNDKDMNLDIGIEDGWEEIKEKNREKIEGAYRKWGKKN